MEEKRRRGGATKTYGEEKIRNVMGNVDGQAHVGEVESIAQANQAQGDDVVAHQLLEVLARLLQHQEKHNHLLGPVAGLNQVVSFEQGGVGLVGEPVVHGRGVEVPQVRLAHDIEAQRAEKGEVYGGVSLFHEAGLLGARSHAVADGHGAEESLHDELAGEGEEDGVKGDEDVVIPALAVERRG
jgi:hypothetical protein